MKENHQAGEIKSASPFVKKLDNYWYHYKWHTIIALFLVTVILVCSFQMFKKDEYDIEVLYAGPSSKLNDMQTILDIEAAFSDLLTDQNGDGKVTVNLVSYWVNSDIAENGELSDTDINYTLNYSMTNKQAYIDETKAGNVSVFLVSPELFHLVDDEAGFMRVTDIFPELEEYQNEVCVFDEDGKINRFGVVDSNDHYKTGYTGWVIYANYAAFEFKVNEKIAIGLNLGSLDYAHANVKDKDSDAHVATGVFKFDINSGNASFRVYF